MEPCTCTTPIRVTQCMVPVIFHLWLHWMKGCRKDRWLLRSTPNSQSKIIKVHTHEVTAMCQEVTWNAQLPLQVLWKRWSQTRVKNRYLLQWCTWPVFDALGKEWVQTSCQARQLVHTSLLGKLRRVEGGPASYSLLIHCWGRYTIQLATLIASAGCYEDHS